MIKHNRKGEINMENKFMLTQEQNIFFAKRNIVDSLWKSANLEGIAITFPETQKIYDKIVNYYEATASSNYLYLSRKAVLPASFSKPEDFFSNQLSKAHNNLC